MCSLGSRTTMKASRRNACPGKVGGISSLGGSCRLTDTKRTAGRARLSARKIATACVISSLLNGSSGCRAAPARAVPATSCCDTIRAPSRRGSGAGGGFGDAAVQLGPAVGVDVVGGAGGLAEGVAEPAFGGDGDRPRGHGRLG